LAVLASPAYARERAMLLPNAQAERLWEQYKSTFIQNDGRIIDTRQAQMSHSEGQGYGMLSSVLHDDRTTFHKIWQWTQNNLQSRKDHLFAWAWGKRQNDHWGVIDYNNATDGDLLIAYALLKASAKWNDTSYKTEGLKIIDGIRTFLSIRWDNRLFLLPAYYGFKKVDGVVLNPSYVILSAYRSFAEIDDKTFWNKVYEDGLFLIEKSSFGKLKLPSDWVVLRKTGISIHEERAPHFGYESIRTILYLAWEKNPKFPEGINAILKIYKQLGYIPLYVDLSKDTISLEEAPAGFYAVYARAAEKSGDTALSEQLFEEALKKVTVERDDYYSMSLFLLALKNADS
jgi:endoglucanase